MENLFSSIDQKFNSLLKMIFKEKVAVEDLIHNSGNPPLLPTPPSFHIAQMEEVNATGHKVSRPFLPNPPKLDLVVFSGENLRE